MKSLSFSNSLDLHYKFIGHYMNLKYYL
ncbi:IS1 family transposase [Klebsiella quasipneumoniae]